MRTADHALTWDSVIGSKDYPLEWDSVIGGSERFPRPARYSGPGTAEAEKENARASVTSTSADAGITARPNAARTAVQTPSHSSPTPYSTLPDGRLQEESNEKRKENTTRNPRAPQFGDVFTIIKERVTVPECFSQYGYPPDSRGFIRCPFHGGGSERTPSLHMAPRYWKCFACQSGGTVIDAVMELFNLSALDAAKQINQDFHLGLSLDGHRPTAAEVKAARTRAKTRAISDAFLTWADSADRLLSHAVYIANAALEQGNPDAWTPQETAAVKYQAEFDHHLSVLEAKTDADADAARLSLLRNWKEVRRRAEFVIGHHS